MLITSRCIPSLNLPQQNVVQENTFKRRSGVRLILKSIEKLKKKLFTQKVIKLYPR